MEQRPEQPPEGRLIADATERMNLSIREAARRAGISYGRWRQVVSGVQNVSPGSYAKVHAPARTLARMAKVVGVTPEQMETQGQRPDAAEFMRQDAPRARPPRREIDFSGGDSEALHPYRQRALAEIYASIGLTGRFTPGDLPELSEVPGAEEMLALLPASRQPFRAARHEADAWDDEGLLLSERVTIVARMRQLWDLAGETDRSRTGLAAGLYPATSVILVPFPVAGKALRASS